MISIERAWPRVRELPQFKNFRLSDFRTLTFGQQMPVGVAPAAVGPTTQNFPGGAIILGVSASAVPGPLAPAAADAFLYRKTFGITFGYTNGESLTPGGPIMADALMGGGDGTVWPTKEIVVAPNQGIQATVANFCTTALLVHIAYHCLVWRSAS
jgi:hypothetical protein